MAPFYGCHVCPPWNVSEGISYQKFLVRETNARFILIERPFSSFTQTSSESKKKYNLHGSGFNLDSSVSMHFLVQN